MGRPTNQQNNTSFFQEATLSWQQHAANIFKSLGTQLISVGKENEMRCRARSVGEGHQVSGYWARFENQNDVKKGEEHSKVNVLHLADDYNTLDNVKAIRRGPDGEPLTNQRHLEDFAGDIDGRMAIGNLVNNNPMRHRKSQIERKKRRQRKGKRTQRIAAKSLTERVKHYDLLSNLAQANTVINIGQLLCGDVKDAAVIARRIYYETAGKKLMAAFERNSC